MRRSMPSRLLSLASLAFAALISSPAASQTTIYEGARLIVGDGTAIENSAFVVQSNQFTQVGRKGEVQAPAGAMRVDLTGKTVIPTLVDLHGHYGFQNLAQGTMSKDNFTRANLIDHLQRLAYWGVGAAVGVGDLVDRSDLKGGRTGWGDMPVKLRDEVVPGTAGGTAVISAGHGWYWHEASGTWRLQRDYYGGIVEDVVNWDIASYVRDELTAASMDARLLRYPDRDANVGTSGRPRWEEGAKYFIKGLGAPTEVWNIGVDEYARDINTRPMYANWIDSAVMVSIHNNGGRGTGTETWYDATNGQEYESQRLAGIVNNRIVALLRARYNRDWPDRGLRTCNGCKGENRIAARPAIIVEAAFMDTPTPDNDALHDETFKQIVAQAIREGLQEWAQR
jgi:N-acetylmuramoyl-L-alanine amidase